MRESQGRQIPVPQRESPQLIDHHCGLPGDHLQGVTKDQEVCVADDVLAGRAQMDDRPGQGSHIAQRMDMGHDIVPQPRFMPFGGGKVDVVHVRPQLIHLLLRDVQAKLALRLRQGQPHPPPGREFALRRPETSHFGGGISRFQRRLIRVGHEKRLSEAGKAAKMIVAAKRMPHGLLHRSASVTGQPPGE